MDEEEDWDAPAKPTPKAASPQPSNSSTPHITLKITDGYKYSYEALSSPANIDDWIEPPSYGGYGGSRRSSNGYSQNSFRDNNRSFNNDRNGGNKRFDPLRRNNNFSNDDSSRNFGTPKSNRFPSRLPAVPVADWDAPDNSSQANGAWNAINTPLGTPAAEENWDDDDDAPPVPKSTPKPMSLPTFNPNASQSNPSSAADEEDWDAPAGASSSSNKPRNVIPTYTPNSSINSPPRSSEPKSLPLDSSKVTTNDDEEDWDEPSGVAPKSKAIIIPTYNPGGSDLSMGSLDQINTEEDWDADPSDKSNSSGNGFSKTIPTFNPNGHSGQSYSSNPINQRYENNYHSNKYPHSRNYESHHDRFGREPFNRHSRGNNRNSPYERYDRGGRGGRGFGRGGRGGRGGRDGRDGRDRDGPYQSSYNRDSRHREDRHYQSNSFNRHKNDRSFQPPPPSFNHTVVEAEEDWDSPSGFKESSSSTSAENNISVVPVQMAPLPSENKAADDEESWD